MEVLSIHIKPSSKRYGKGPELEASVKVSVPNVGSLVVYGCISAELLEKVRAEALTAAQQKLAGLTTPANFDFSQLGQTGHPADTNAEVEHA